MQAQAKQGLRIGLCPPLPQTRQLLPVSANEDNVSWTCRALRVTISSLLSFIVLVQTRVTKYKEPDLPETPMGKSSRFQWHHFFRWVRSSFLTGLVIAAPIWITIYVTLAFISFIDDFVTPFIPAQYNPATYLPFSIPGLGVLVVFVLLTLLGSLTANLFGRSIINFGEKMVDRMPVVRNIYNALKQIFETVVSQSRTTFQDVGLIEYPREGVYAICFITTNTGGEIQSRIDDDSVSVFLPTTPNPTSGFLLFVPRNDIQLLDMTVEEGAKLVISAGLVEPNHQGVPKIDPDGVKVKREAGGDTAAE